MKFVLIFFSAVIITACKKGVDVESNYSPPLVDGEGSDVTVTSPPNSPYYSSGDNLEIRGVCNPGATIILSGNSTDSVTCANDGSFSFIINRGLDGTYNYDVAQQNGSLTTSPESLVWIKKSSVSVPAITHPSTNPFGSASTSLNVQGSCETGASIEIEVDSSVQNTLCINSSFSLEIFKFTDGDFNVDVRQIDQAGNMAQTSFVWSKSNITANPSNPQVIVTRNQVFTVSGGSPPYTATFTDNQSGGSFDDNTLTYTAGQTSGVTDTLEITDSLNFVVNVNISVIPDVPDHFEFPLNSGNFQSQIVGESFTDPILAQIVDFYGNPVPNTSVVFKETSGDIDLRENLVVLTDAQGIASVNVDQGFASVRSTLVATALSGPLPDIGSTGRTALNYQLNGNNNNTGNIGLNFGVGSGAEDILVADFDNDGLDDMVVLNKGERSLSVFLGRESGVFQVANKVLNLCTGPSAIGVGDFNADADIDILLTCASDTNYFFIEGLGDGNFVNPVATAIDANESIIVDLVVGDINGDSVLDMATVSAGTSKLGVRYGNNDGTFQNPVLYDVGASSSKVALADVDNMNGQDVLILSAASSNETVAVFLNNGTGALATPGPSNTYFTSESPSDLYVADFNGDNYLDFVTASSTLNEVSIFMNLADGTFNFPNTVQVGSSPTSVHAYDYDGDNNLDIFVTNIGDNTVSILTGNGNGSFGSGGTLDTKVSPIFTSSIDANNDGSQDLIVAATGSSEVQIFLGDSGGSLGLETEIDPGSKAMLGFDYNQDGIRDKAVLSESSNTLKIYTGNSKGSYSLFVNLSIGLVTPSALISDDFNSDGFPDLAVTNSGTGTLVVYTNSSGTGFGSPQILPVLSQPMALTSGDLDSDGFSDIVVTNSGANQFSVFLNNGTGNFTSRVDRSTGAQPLGVKVADVNQDRILDVLLVTGSDSQDNLSVYYGNGDGTFGNPNQFDAGDSPSSLVVGNFNTDSFVDVAVLNSISANISVFLGVPGGSFLDASNVFAGTTPQDLVMADINGDNLQDLLVSNGLNQRVNILYGSVSGNYSLIEEIRVGVNSIFLDIDDVNSDGAVDLSIIDGTDSRFKTLLGH